jgi:hypothetical protein
LGRPHRHNASTDTNEALPDLDSGAETKVAGTDIPGDGSTVAGLIGLRRRRR